jgi:glutamate-1-semialdehyde 2,1-aminomutase
MPNEFEDPIPGRILGSHSYPDGLNFVADRGEGPLIFATDGRQFTDYVLGSGPMIVGHAHPAVVEAIREQAGRGTHLYAMNETALELAERIVKHVPCAQALKFVGDGAEATFYAMRIARAFTGRTKILKFEGGYHGHHDYGQFGLTPTHGRNESHRQPDSAGIPAAISDTVLVAPFNDLETATSLALEHASDLAAIIVEPVQRSVPPRSDFLPGLRALCDRIGALLIFDELVTGFRLAFGGAQEIYGVIPDLCALGKVIGGGLPLAAVAGRRDLIALTVPDRAQDGRSVFLSGTLNGNSLCCAAGLATLRVLEEENGPAKIAESGRRLAAGFHDAAERLSIPFQMLGPPAFPEPIFGEEEIHDFAGHAATNQLASRQFGIEMTRRGNHVLFVAKYYLSTAHGDDHIAATCEAAYDAMRAVRDGGYLDRL